MLLTVPCSAALTTAAAPDAAAAKAQAEIVAKIVQADYPHMKKDQLFKEAKKIYDAFKDKFPSLDNKAMKQAIKIMMMSNPLEVTGNDEKDDSMQIAIALSRVVKSPAKLLAISNLFNQKAGDGLEAKRSETTQESKLLSLVGKGGDVLQLSKVGAEAAFNPDDDGAEWRDSDLEIKQGIKQQLTQYDLCLLDLEKDLMNKMGDIKTISTAADNLMEGTQKEFFDVAKHERDVAVTVAVIENTILHQKQLNAYKLKQEVKVEHMQLQSDAAMEKQQAEADTKTAENAKIAEESEKQLRKDFAQKEVALNQEMAELRKAAKEMAEQYEGAYKTLTTKMKVLSEM